MNFDDESNRFTSYEKELNKICDSEVPTITKLTPEFFFSPEFLGTGAGLEGVKLPAFSSTPEEFVYRNRRALESEAVSKDLASRIDLSSMTFFSMSAFNSVD